jgi:hypothetical protein
VTGATTAAAISPVTLIDPDTAGFDHVLAGVGLTGPTARLAGLLEAGFLTEAGWDPAARVLSPPAAHPLLGRTLCRVGGCLSTAHSGPTGHGMSGQQIAALPELPPLPARPAGCAVAGCQRMSPSPRATLCESHPRRWRRKPGTSLEQFLTDPAVRPLLALQPCLVAACIYSINGAIGFAPVGGGSSLAAGRIASPAPG